MSSIASIVDSASYYGAILKQSFQTGVAIAVKKGPEEVTVADAAKTMIGTVLYPLALLSNVACAAPVTEEEIFANNGDNDAELPMRRGHAPGDDAALAAPDAGTAEDTGVTEEAGNAAFGDAEAADAKADAAVKEADAEVYDSGFTQEDIQEIVDHCSEEPVVEDIPWQPTKIKSRNKPEPSLFRAYQVPGEIFRIVVQEPNTIAEDYIFALYAGFRAAKCKLARATGLEALPRQLPVDLHIASDDYIGEYTGEGPNGWAGWYSKTSGLYSSYIAAFLVDVDKANNRPSDPEMALRVEQNILVHEYLHVILSDRTAFSDQSLAYVFSYYVSGWWQGNGTGPESFIPMTDADLAGSSWEKIAPLTCYLAQENGLTFQDLKESLIKLDRMYQAGEGDYYGYGNLPKPMISANQYRLILNKILGSETRQAFIDAGYGDYLKD